MLRPGTVAEVSAILRLASETRTAVVPQGGNTGLVGGQVPSARGDEVIVSLSRLDRIRSVDADSYTMTLEAGVTLAAAQAAAEAAGRLLPLSLASEGSCQIGGNISTNAGGTGVLAYGNTRELVLGLEVVLPSGEVWDGLRTLRKDNTGYDLKNLFIGAEGTLGIVTGAVLLFRAAARPQRRFFGGDPAAALALFRVARAHGGRHRRGDRPGSASRPSPRSAGTRDPLATPHPWYLL